MYRTPGKRTVIKKNIREFSGLVYDDEEKDRAKTTDLIGRAFGSTLNAILDIFDLPRGAGPEGVKEAKVGRIVAFLEKPEASAKKNLKVSGTNGPNLGAWGSTVWKAMVYGERATHHGSRVPVLDSLDGRQR